MGAADLSILVVVVAASLAFAWFNVGRAWLYLSPEALVFEPEAPWDQVTLPDALVGPSHELTEQSFVPLGTRAERSWRRKTLLTYEFGRLEDGTFASLWLTSDAEIRVSFMTWTEKGAFLSTSNHRRPVRDEPGRYLSSYIENASVSRLIKAHSRRLNGETGQGPITLEGRVELARTWLAGPGRAEIRQQHLSGLLWTLGTLGMLAAAVFGRR